MAQRTKRTARATARVVVPPAVPRITRLSPAQALCLPLTFTLLLLAFTLLPAVRENRRLLLSFSGSGAALLAWTAILFFAAVRRRRMLAIDVVLRGQHYMQACAQLAVLLYWGWYWRQVYDFAYLIAAQLAFAYAVDALLTWSRRDTYTLGFGPFPIIFSTNLFLWFKPDWFYLQFLMVAVGFAAKATIQWTKDGRPAHIFNPSSFTLAVFSIGLIATGSTHITWGQEIASSQLLPPHIYLLIVLVSLPGQFLFGVASMTLAAVVTTLAFGLLYYAITGTYFFFEPSIPIAVFLGMHLLFTDPSTSPRTELGRLMFGILYGLSVVALFALLGRAGIATFYDKLLAVPILNLMIQGIDRVARSRLLTRLDPAAIAKGLTPRTRNVAYMCVWVVIFATMQLLTGNEVALARADVLMSQGRVEEAIARYRELVQRDPAHVAGHNKLGFALIQAGRSQDAVATLERARTLQPDNPETHNNLGLALMQAGRVGDAVSSLEQAVAIRPEYAEGHYNLAHAYTGAGNARAAAEHFRDAIRLRPDWPAAMGALAWLYATHPATTPPDAEEGVRLATRAADLSGRRDAPILDALAASYAAAGRFEEATRAAEAAEALASPPVAAEIRARLSLYRAGQPLVRVNR